MRCQTSELPTRRARLAPIIAALCALLPAGQAGVARAEHHPRGGEYAHEVPALLDPNTRPRAAGGGPLGNTLPSVAPRHAEEERIPPESLMHQSAEQAQAKSTSCVACHGGIEPMHASPVVQLGCVDCHGGDPCATTLACAHVRPRFAELWPTAANPVRTFALLNQEDPEFVRFVNPGDFRVAHLSCGTVGCHQRIVETGRKSIMAHSAMVPGSALYNNGAVPNKIYRFGEFYAPDGTAQRAFSTPRATYEDVFKRGVVPWLDPLPNFRVTQPDFRFRILEVNNNATSKRGAGTDFRVDGVFINLQKTKLNDPTMAFLGMNNNPGDYRSSGCTSCHVLYANDRDPDHSAHLAGYGNRGQSISGDPCIRKDEPGHPLVHQFTRRIPNSQCMTCHFHQGSGALGNYLGYIWWDYETDAEAITSRYGRPVPDGKLPGGFSLARHDLAPTVNPTLKGNKFADFHNNTWLYQAVYKRDVKGNLLDRSNQPIDENDPNWHKLAVHLRDIHLERGMHCIDCHFEQDVHGDGRLYGAMIDAVEINCRDCHGTIWQRASLITSNAIGGNDLRRGVTSFGKRRFSIRNGRIYQRSMIHEDLEWEVVQVKDVITPGSPHYNETARYAKTLRKDGVTWGAPPAAGNCELAHADDAMTCYACHTSWNTSCGGCHLSAHTNVLAPNLHYEGEFSKVLAYYNPQAIRHDGFFLGRNGTVQGNRVSPVRAASGVIVSVADGNRATVVHQHPTLAAEGHSGHAFSPNPPHTVYGKGLTRQCSGCHVSDQNSNNALVAQALGLGVRSCDFVGRYAYVALGHKGIAAVQVASSADFPTPVIGSDFQRIVEPAAYLKHVERNGRTLKTAYKHRTKEARSILHFGEWLVVADGPGGVRIFDAAFIHNKDIANRLVTAGISPLGQRQDIRSNNATWVTVASTLPVDMSRTRRPENEEQPLAQLFRYVFATDYHQGLILADALPLLDGIPDNNFLSATTVYNPDGLLCTATRVEVHGNHAWVLTERNGLSVIDVSDARCPRIVARLAEPEVVSPRAIDFQFRYAFVCDRQGLKVIDATFAEAPRVVAALTFADARDVWIQKTQALIAAGADGLALVDVTRPDRPALSSCFDAGGCINDATAVVTGMEGNSWYAFLADGCNGLRVIQLLSPSDGSRVKGFSPDFAPRLVASYPTDGPCLAVSRGIARDRYVDIDGNQIGVFGRRGSRPFDRQEIRRMYLRGGQLYTVTDQPMTAPMETEIEAPAAEYVRAGHRERAGKQPKASRAPGNARANNPETQVK
jgi:hypothetical protein